LALNRFASIIQYARSKSYIVFYATFNNISVISMWSVLLMEETGEPGENHGPVASHWQTISHNVVHLVLICKSNHLTITATTTPYLYIVYMIKWFCCNKELTYALWRRKHNIFARNKNVEQQYKRCSSTLICVLNVMLGSI
jgi:hypothetical protein